MTDQELNAIKTRFHSLSPAKLGALQAFSECCYKLIMAIPTLVWELEKSRARTKSLERLIECHQIKLGSVEIDFRNEYENYLSDPPPTIDGVMRATNH